MTTDYDEAMKRLQVLAEKVGAECCSPLDVMGASRDTDFRTLTAAQLEKFCVNMETWLSWRAGRK